VLWCDLFLTTSTSAPESAKLSPHVRNMSRTAIGYVWPSADLIGIVVR